MSQEDGDDLDGVGELGDLGDVRAMCEAHQQALLGRDDIPPEVSVLIAGLDMDAVVAAGGIAEYLRTRMAEERSKLRAEVEAHANRFGQGPEFVEKILAETAPAVLKKHEDALLFVESPRQ
jgi:hypothetical protein